MAPLSISAFSFHANKIKYMPLRKASQYAYMVTDIGKLLTMPTPVQTFA